MVPKPHTGFERQPMVDPKLAQKNLKELSRRLKKLSNIRVSFDGSQWAYRQTLVARGGRELLEMMIHIAEEGDSAWQAAIRANRQACDRLVLNEQTAEILPWHFVSRKGA